jgi:hypothetical protein
VLFRLMLLFLSFPLGATVFQLQSVNQQITDADGIIIGHYLRSRSVQLDDGKIVTQMIFKMNKEVGMQSEIFGMDEIIVHYPGGQMGDIIEKIEGVPSFIPGEKVVIMIKSTQDRFWGMNLGFGTFKVINYGNQKLIVNTLFPNDLRVGQMNLDVFENNVKLIKRSSFKIVHTPISPTEIDKNSPQRLPAAIEEQGKNRAIASNSEPEENERGQTGFTTLWLGFLFAAMGGLFRLSRQKEAK